MVKKLRGFDFSNVEGTYEAVSPQFFPYEHQSESTKHHYSDHIPMDKLDLLDKFGWLTEEGTVKEIDYTVYGYGFRTPLHLDKREQIVFIGCSNTFGSGLNPEQTFAYKIAQSLNLPLVNLGVPGASLDECYRLLKIFLPKLNPTYVCCLLPDAMRTEIFIDGEIKKTSKHFEVYGTTARVPLTVHSYDEIEEGTPELHDHLKVIQRHTITNLESQLINYNRNLDALKYLCRGTRLITIPTLKYFRHKDAIRVINQKNYGKARDLSHFGEPWHDIVTQDFLKLINIKKNEI